MQLKRKKVWFVAIPIIILLSYLIWDAYSQPSIKNIPGDFEEVAFVRNEQNKGGVIRIYAVTVGDLATADFEACADLFPTNDFNSVTTVYFFDKKDTYPTSLTLDTPHYDALKYRAIHIAKRRGQD